MQGEHEEEKEAGGKREKPVVRPEEIPPVPENRFLLRRDMPSQQVKTEMLALKGSNAQFTPKSEFYSNCIALFSVLREKKRQFQLTRNQPCQSLGGGSEAEER